MTTEDLCKCCDLPAYSCGKAWAARNGVDIAEIDKALAAEMAADDGAHPWPTVLEAYCEGRALREERQNDELWRPEGARVGRAVRAAS